MSCNFSAVRISEQEKIDRKWVLEEEGRHWSVFDGVIKTIPGASPEALMVEINSAISSLEYARATAFLRSPNSVSRKNSNDGKFTTSKYDARKADEAYKSGMAAMASGKLDEAIHALNVALSNCPPDKTSAVAKLQSLISSTSQKIQKSSN